MIIYQLLRGYSALWSYINYLTGWLIRWKQSWNEWQD